MQYNWTLVLASFILDSWTESKKFCSKVMTSAFCLWGSSCIISSQTCSMNKKNSRRLALFCFYIICILEAHWHHYIHCSMIINLVFSKLARPCLRDALIYVLYTWVYATILINIYHYWSAYDDIMISCFLSLALYRCA